MSDYISRNALGDELHSGNIVIYCRTPHEVKMLRKLSGEIDRVLLHIPAADVQPVRHGRWILAEYPYGQKTYLCSECKDDDWWNSKYAYGDERYCPNCGAKMGGEDT